MKEQATPGHQLGQTGAERLLLTVVLAAYTLVLLDNTVLNVAVDVLSDPDRGLGASTTELTWAVSVYPLAFAASALAGGALTDRLGDARVLNAGLVLLGIASCVAAFAPNGAVLIGARAGMGVAGGLVAPATLTMITRGVARERRARAIAGWTSAAGIAVAVGPIVGGLLLTRFSWQAIFLVNVPAAACLAIAAAFLPDGRVAGVRRALDLPGSLLSGLGLAAFVFGVIECGRRVSLDAVTVLLAGVALLVVFTWHELRRRTPAFDVRLLGSRVFGGGVAGLFLSFAGLAGQLFYCAFYLQGVLGLSPAQAGFVMVSAAAGIVLGSRLAPAVVRWLSVRAIVLSGLLVASATYGAYVFFDENTAVMVVVTVLFVQGLGTGLGFAPLTAALVDRLPADRTGAGSAIVAVVRPLGSTVGAAAFGALLTAAYRAAIFPALAGVPDAAAGAAEGSVEAAHSAGADFGVPDLSRAADTAYLHAMHLTAGWTAAAALAGCAILTAALGRKPGWS